MHPTLNWQAHKDVFMAYFWFRLVTFAKSFSRPVGPSKTFMWGLLPTVCVATLKFV